MKKDYNQHLTDLKSGLAQINRIIINPKNVTQQKKALKLIDVQEARIESFKFGYNIRSRELKEQQELNQESENITEKVLEDINSLEKQEELE